MRPTACNTLLLSMLLFCYAISAHAQRMMVPPGGASAVQRVALRTPVVVVPLIAPGGRPMVDVMLNGKGPFRLAIETGMPGVALFPETVQRAGLGSSPPAAGYPVLDSLGIGGLSLYGVQYMVGPPIFPGVIDGFLGLSAYAKLLLTIDNAGREVRFEQGTLKPNGEGVIPIIKSDALWDKLLFDTQGGGMSVMLYGDVAAKMRMDGPLTTTGLSQSPAFGVLPKQVARLADTVRIAGYAVPRPIITVQQSRMHDRDGFLGIDFLSQFTTTLDQASQLVRFSYPGRVLPEAPPVGGRGISCTFSKGPLKVLGVAPGSPGDEAGIQSGDVVVEANGASTVAFGPADWDRLNTLPGEVTLLVERTGERRTVKVPYRLFVP